MKEQTQQHASPFPVYVNVASKIRRAFGRMVCGGSFGIALRGLSLRSGRRHGAVRAGRFKSEVGAEAVVLLIIVVMLGALCLGMDPALYQAVTERIGQARQFVSSMFRQGQAQVESRPSAVLLVSSRQRDYVRVVGTLSPRGVSVVRASDVPAGLRLVSDGQFVPGMLVVDGELPNVKRLVRESRQRFPELTVLVLERRGDPSVTTAALMTYAERVKLR